VTPQIAAKLKNDAKAIYKDGPNEFMGKVSSISNSPSVLTGLYELTLEFSNLKTDDKFLIIDVEASTLPKANVVPIASISLREAKPFVYKIVEGNKIEKEYVDITGKNFEYYAVKANLKAGDLVVTSDLRDLNPSKKILIVE
jgi:cell shape-determining protein MreC